MEYMSFFVSGLRTSKNIPDIIKLNVAVEKAGCGKMLDRVYIKKIGSWHIEIGKQAA